MLLMALGCHRPAARADKQDVLEQRSLVSAAPAQVPAEVDYKAQFLDITAQAGVLFRQHHGGCGTYYFPEQIASSAAFFDANGDGHLDIYFPQPKALGTCKSVIRQRLHQRLYINNEKGQFTLAKQAFGNSDTDYGMGASAGDFDNDGDVDLYVTCYGRNTLYKNRGDATFEDVTTRAGVGLTGISTGSVWFDYDGDGHLDLYVARYCRWSVEGDLGCRDAQGRRDPCHPMVYPPDSDVLYHNNGDGTFSNVTAKAGVGTVKRRGLGVAAADFNNDGKLDLLVANDQSPNFLYINRGNGKFQEMAVPLNIAYGMSGEALANMGIAVGDYNDDMRLDAFITEFAHEGYSLYRNDGAAFTYASGESGIFQATLPYLAFGTGFVDTRNNGRLDLFVANGHVWPRVSSKDPGVTFKQRNQLLLNNGRGTFVDSPSALPKDDVRVHRGAAFGDIDNDGRVDVLVTASDDRPTLLHNNSRAGNWLIVQMVNKQGCATPIGARCIATIGKKRILRAVVGGGSYAGESDHRIHIGLGNATKVDKLEIRWMSGAGQVFTDVAANQILMVREGEKLESKS
jgi:hypothetical protein